MFIQMESARGGVAEALKHVVHTPLRIVEGLPRRHLRQDGVTFVIEREAE
jgi:hypothetical protein